MTGVREQPDHWHGERADQRGDREQETQLGVVQVQVATNQRQGGCENAEGELVEELDREEEPS